MPKTKDAFALRGFDTKRILQRPYFKDLNLPVDDDTLIKENFFANISNLRDASERLSKIESLNDYAQNYLMLLQKHIERLRKIACEYLFNFKDDNEKKYALIDRAMHLRDFYSDLYSNILNPFYDEIITPSVLTGRIFFLSRYRTEFSSRLRKSREEVGLTQKIVAEKLGLTRNAYTLYENGKRDVPTHILARLAIIFKKSTDWLLGITD